MDKIAYECRNPVYTENGRIDLEWNHPEHGWIPFTADPEDVMPYGVEIFNAAVAGEFGQVSEYVAPDPAEMAELQARSYRDGLLSEMDVFVSNPLRWSSLTQEKQDEWAAYRQALLDVPQQSGFPLTIDWPTQPE